MPSLRIAFLHLAPSWRDLQANRRLVDRAVTTAAAHGATWILTPELCICGYDFTDALGTAWIVPPPDPWMASLCQRAADLGVTVFLSHPERDAQSGQCYNTLFVIAADGRIVGKHRKIRTLSGAEGWSSPGQVVAPVLVPPVGQVGLLICADAYTPEIATRLKSQGAQLLVSAAAWGPGLHGPHGEWERCTRETGLPLLVCNRTGIDRTLRFTAAESLVVQDGQRLCAFTSARSALFLIAWDLETRQFSTPEPQRVDL
jgi:N-carbamoylputrescine amidase